MYVKEIINGKLVLTEGERNRTKCVYIVKSGEFEVKEIKNNIVYCNI